MEILYRSKIATVGKFRNTRERMFGMGDASTTSRKRYDLLKNIARAYAVHTWTNATLNSVGRSVTGSGWKFVRSTEGVTGDGAKELEKLENFFHQSNRDFANIQDYLPVHGKIHQTILSYLAFGQVGWEVVKKGNRVVGFEVISGYIEPNVDERGMFLEPAFTVYPWDYEKTGTTVEYSTDEMVYFFDPGLTGNILGESRYESLTSTSIPSDLYAAKSYANLFKNVNAPYNGVWKVDAGVSDEDFDMFVELLEQRYSGVENYGRNPLVIRGGAEFNQTKSRSEEDAPYLDGRRYNQQEMSAVTGVDGNKLGISGGANKANMRETRREFHENTMRPLFVFFEEAIYIQVIVRFLKIKDWKLVFNRPDFMNALEQATIDMRYLQNGVYNPNEIRGQHGKKRRDGGDDYYDPPNMNTGKSDNSDGDSGSDNTNSRNDQKPLRPPRDEESPKGLDESVAELKSWRKHYLRAMDGKREQREFVVKSIPVNMSDVIKGLLEECEDFDDVKKVFDSAAIAIDTHWGGEIE